MTDLDPELVEATAKWLAERINGGLFAAAPWYTPEQCELWRGHARAMLTESPVAEQLRELAMDALAYEGQMREAGYSEGWDQG